MKLGFALAALALGAMTTLSGSLGAEEDYAKDVTVEAKRDGGKLKLTLKPKKDGLYVNKDYPIKCSLKIADGGKLEKTELAKADAKYEDAGKEGKAKSVSFSTGADKAVDAECKLVVCTDATCSAPFKVTGKSN
jgi:hypothetical protein